MATLFYLAFVFFKPYEWSWGWFFISILFSCASEGRTIIKYRYTTDIFKEGEEEEE